MGQSTLQWFDCGLWGVNPVGGRGASGVVLKDSLTEDAETGFQPLPQNQQLPSPDLGRAFDLGDGVKPTENKRIRGE